MKTLLICPSERPAVRHLSAATPLACAPLLGRSLLEYWLSHLAASGRRRVLILAADRPEAVLDRAGNGARWGLTVEVIPESRELAPAQALLKYGAALDAPSPEDHIRLLDHLPGQAIQLFASYADWFAGLRAWIPQARTPERVGLRELQPGIWAGLNARLSPDAHLQPPCWLGDHVFVGAGARLGPGVILEQGAFVEPLAEVVDSYVGPHTFVGRFTRLRTSLALANRLIDYPSGSVLRVPDDFILSGLRRPPRTHSAAGWLVRLLELGFRKREEFQLLAKHLSIKR